MNRRLSIAHSYPESCYDDQMCLKPPLLLWVAVLFLSRAVTLPIAMGIGHVVGVDARAMAATRGFWSLDSLVPSLIAVVVLYGLFRRVPGAGAPVPWIWARGRIFLSVAATLDIALIAIDLVRQGILDGSSSLSLGAALIDAYFLVYIIVARRVRDTFAEFPEPLTPPGAARTPPAAQPSAPQTPVTQKQAP